MQGQYFYGVCLNLFATHMPDDIEDCVQLDW